MSYKNMLWTACLGALLVGGCTTDKEKAADEASKKTEGVDKATSEKAPSKLGGLLGENKQDKANSELIAAAAAGDVMSPLEKQLQQLKEIAEKNRTELTQSQQKSEEYQRRSDEIKESLKKTEQKIGKVEKIIKMINEDPNALERNLALGQQAAKEAGVPSLSEAGPLTADMPALGTNSPLQGSGEFGATLPRNELKVEQPAAAKAPAKSAAPALTLPAEGMWNTAGTANANKPLTTPESKPAAAKSGKSLAPGLDAMLPDGPEAAEDKKGIWREKSVPTPGTDGKILLCDGKDAGMEFIISLGKKDGVTEGMLFEATGEGNEKNVLVVTRVYQANAEAKLHPRFAAGGLKDGLALKKLASLPE